MQSVGFDVSNSRYEYVISQQQQQQKTKQNKIR